MGDPGNLSDAPEWLWGSKIEAMEEGQKVWAPHPVEGEIRAVFLAPAQNEPVEVDGFERSAAWISWEEGEDEATTARVPYFKLKARTE